MVYFFCIVTKDLFVTTFFQAFVLLGLCNEAITKRGVLDRTLLIVGVGEESKLLEMNNISGVMFDVLRRPLLVELKIVGQKWFSVRG